MPLAVDTKWWALASARLNIAMAENGEYYVSVHALATNMARSSRAEPRRAGE